MRAQLPAIPSIRVLLIEPELELSEMMAGELKSIGAHVDVYHDLEAVDPFVKTHSWDMLIIHCRELELGGNKQLVDEIFVKNPAARVLCIDSCGTGVGVEYSRSYSILSAPWSMPDFIQVSRYLLFKISDDIS